MQLKLFAIILFTKEPELGKVKTRLASALGDATALRIYTHLLQYTNTLLQKAHTELQADIHIFWAEEPQHKTQLFSVQHTSHVQEGKDLGERMHNAFNLLLKEYQYVMIIGGDCLQLSIADMREGLQAIQSADIVIGPANDGGYYTLLQKMLIPEIFMHKRWSHTSVLSDTLADLQRLEKKVYCLDTHIDIDTLDDLMASKATHLALE